MRLCLQLYSFVVDEVRNSRCRCVRAGADGLLAAFGDTVPYDDLGRRLDQPCGGVPDGGGAAAGRHRRHGVLELARPVRAAQLAAPWSHIQRQTISNIQNL